MQEYPIIKEKASEPDSWNTGNDGIKKDENYSEEKRFYLMRYMPLAINYFYADLKHAIDKLQNYKRLKKLFRKKVGYELNLDEPKSFNEKITWKKLNDRNPLLTVTADKFEVRSYIKDLLGEKVAEKILVTLYQVRQDPSKINFNELPEKFVIKSNHGSRMHIIVKDKRLVNKDQIVKKCREWLKVPYGIYHYEWAYRNIRKKIIVEKLLETACCDFPRDYRFHCIHGSCKQIRVLNNRFGNNEDSFYYNARWEVMQISNPGYEIAGVPFEKPENGDEMVRLAEKLAGDFDSVRVDLYSCDGRIYFSELTHYRGSGMLRFEPESYDYELGAHWNLEPYYWLKNKG